MMVTKETLERQYQTNMLTPSERAALKVICDAVDGYRPAFIARAANMTNHRTVLALHGLTEKGLAKRKLQNHGISVYAVTSRGRTWCQENG